MCEKEAGEAMASMARLISSANGLASRSLSRERTLETPCTLLASAAAAFTVSPAPATNTATEPLSCKAAAMVESEPAVSFPPSCSAITREEARREDEEERDALETFSRRLAN